MEDRGMLKPALATSFPIPTDSSQDYNMPLAWRSKTHGCQPQPPFPGQGLRFGRHSSPCLGDEQLSRHLALRNKNIHPIYRLSEGMRIILEHDVADMDARQRGFTKHSRGCPCTYRVQS